jgi:hypothetical protein
VRTVQCFADGPLFLENRLPVDVVIRTAASSQGQSNDAVGLYGSRSTVLKFAFPIEKLGHILFVVDLFTDGRRGGEMDDERRREAEKPAAVRLRLGSV